jgi:hypothetical protein
MQAVRERRQFGTMEAQRTMRAAMRPNKRINPGAHRSGTADRTSKGRFFTTRLPAQPADAIETADSKPVGSVPVADPRRESKYVGRASVGPQMRDHDSADADLAHTDWVDPLVQEEIDLTRVTIDLRSAMIDDPPDTYYQRHSSRVPGHQ